jgi:hypothetical protein
MISRGVSLGLASPADHMDYETAAKSRGLDR